MFALIGTVVEYTPNSYKGGSDKYEDSEVVALFSTRKKAEQYIKDSRLKQPKRVWGGEKPFRNKSLLSRFNWADIEEWEDPEYIVDPVIT